MSFEKHITPKLCSIMLFQGRFVHSLGGGGGSWLLLVHFNDRDWYCLQCLYALKLRSVCASVSRDQFKTRR